MSFARSLTLLGLMLLGGCVYGVRERDDAVQCELSLQPYDMAPPGQATSPLPISGPEKAPAPRPPDKKQGDAAPAAPTDVQTTALLQGVQAEKPDDITRKALERFRMPSGIPGSATPALDFSKMTPAEREAAIKNLYPPLPPLPEAPAALLGPGGKPYTLADLQLLASKYSWSLKQAISDVDAARGNLLTARAYPNPTFAFGIQPSATGLSPTVQSLTLEQPIKTGGKLKLAEASARMDLLNAELALRKARNDLSTAVRNAYFGVLVARETVRVNRAVSVMTEEIYRIQVDLAQKLAATYEPSVLQGQAALARLNYEQSIRSYAAAWSQLAATIGLRERDLPLSEVAGQIDAFVPRYEYETVLAHVLTRHTDVLTVRNGIEKGKYNLKLQQITPWFQDFDVTVGVTKDYSVPPNNVVPTIQIGTPLSVWDQNKGNVIAAEAALTRALEEPHRVEMSLTNTLAMNFANYRNNLLALQRYREQILPAQVRAYRGVFERRYLGGAEVRTPVAFADVVTAQQALITSVSAYLGILQSLWSSVVSVADLLQTDDLFQLGQPEAVPPIPDLDHLLPLPCGHECPAPAAPGCTTPIIRGQAPDDTPVTLPAPTVLPPTMATPTFAPAAVPGPYCEVDPLLDRPPLPPPGWFADIDLGAVIPHVKNHMSGPVQLGIAAGLPEITSPRPDIVALPNAALDWTAFPRFEAGYRLPSGFGAFSLSYRFLDTQGNSNTVGLDGPAFLHSRLSLNELQCEYTSDETSLWPNWDMKWAVGVRTIWMFFDSRADEPPALAAGGSTVFEQRESNWYWGIGPNVGLELDRQVGCTGLAFVLRGDFSIYLGRLRQRFAEASTTGLFGETSEGVEQGVPTFGTFVGFRWQPPQWPEAILYLGYQYEHWWDIARNNQTTSTGELNVQGIFVRGEWRF
jgi:cobalt-zinc-cadmium efflux system outer membrane protein